MKTWSTPFLRTVVRLQIEVVSALLGVAAANAADYPTTILSDNPVAYYRLP